MVDTLTGMKRRAGNLESQSDNYTSNAQQFYKSIGSQSQWNTNDIANGYLASPAQGTVRN